MTLLKEILVLVMVLNLFNSCIRSDQIHFLMPTPNSKDERKKLKRKLYFHQLYNNVYWIFFSVKVTIFNIKIIIQTVSWNVDVCYK